jgi:hypothetical protein
MLLWADVRANVHIFPARWTCSRLHAARDRAHHHHTKLTLIIRSAPHRQFFQTRYEDLQQGLFAQQAALFPADVFTFDNFLWAVATVRSRAHAPLEADKIALVPLADSIPHSRSGNTSWKVKAGGLFSRAQVGSMAWPWLAAWGSLGRKAEVYALHAQADHDAGCCIQACLRCPSVACQCASKQQG